MIKKLFLISLMTAFIAFTSKPKEDKLTLKTQEKEYTVRLVGQKWLVVLKGISELPLKESQGLYMEIVTQIQAQDSLTKKK